MLILSESCSCQTTKSMWEAVKYNSKFKSGQQLKSERFCFHSDCRRPFNRDKILLSRKRKVEEDND